MQTSNQSNDINGVVVLRSYYEALVELQKEDQHEILMAIMKYGFDGASPTFSQPLLKAVWKLIEPTLERSIARYQSSVENGKKGGRPRKTQAAPQNDNKTVEEAGAKSTSETDDADTPTLGIFPEQENEFTRMFEKDDPQTIGYSFEVMMQLTEGEEDLRKTAEGVFGNKKPDSGYLSQSYFYVVKNNARLMEKYRAIYSLVHREKALRLS